MSWWDGKEKRKAADDTEQRIWEAKTKDRWRKDGESEEDISEAADWFKFGGQGKPEKKKGWWD